MPQFVPPNVAVLHYHSPHGTDTILYLTTVTDKRKLPKITKRLLSSGGVLDPLSEEDESAEWVHILSLNQLPCLQTPARKS